VFLARFLKSRKNKEGRSEIPRAPSLFNPDYLLIYFPFFVVLFFSFAGFFFIFIPPAFSTTAGKNIAGPATVVSQKLRAH
jgi:hypothetical protein